MSNENENRHSNQKPTNFGLPEGYFQTSAAKLMNRLEWQEEHKEFKLLQELKDNTGFVVPKNYFNKREQKTELLDYPVLASLGKPAGFSVPKDYFADAEVLELSKVFSGEESKPVFEIKQNGFKTEASYFQDNETRLKKLLAEEKNDVGIISLFSVKRIGLASAAMLLIALGFWMYGLYTNEVEDKDCGTIACIDRVDLLKAKTLENLETDELYELVNSKKLEENLKSKDTGKKQKEDSSVKSDDEAMDDLLDGI